MLEKAAVHFAAQGFDSSTRDIAAALGVTQALIYKHFDSKDDFIEKTLQLALGDVSIKTATIDPGLELTDMLSTFYRSFVANATETRLKLFMRANLDGRSWPTRRGNVLTNHLFVPVISALRAAANLPTVEDQPLMRGERELTMMLHASMVFLGVRRHIYRMPMPDNLDDVVDLQVKTFVNGAIDSIRDLHASDQESLKVRLLASPT